MIGISAFNFDHDAVLTLFGDGYDEGVSLFILCGKIPVKGLSLLLDEPAVRLFIHDKRYAPAGIFLHRRFLDVYVVSVFIRK